MCQMQSSVGTDTVIMRLKRGSTIIQDVSGPPSTGANWTTLLSPVVVDTPAAGSVTYAAFVARSGTGVAQVFGGATFPSVLVVEDIGPNGNPA
jgi:hypothetical protein